MIVATATPDYTFPAVATQVQANLGIVDAFGQIGLGGKGAHGFCIQNTVTSESTG